MQLFSRRLVHDKCCIFCTLRHALITNSTSSGGLRTSHTPRSGQLRPFSQKVVPLSDDGKLKKELPRRSRWVLSDQNTSQSTLEKNPHGQYGRQDQASRFAVLERGKTRSTLQIRPRLVSRHDPREAAGNNINSDRFWISRPVTVSNSKITKALNSIRANLYDDKILRRLKLPMPELESRWKDFVERTQSQLKTIDRGDQFVSKLREAAQGDIARLEMCLKVKFYGQVLMSTFTKEDLEQQALVSNLRYPMEWFPATRAFKREFHLHVGPTNSGKTYHALKRLEQAESGVYAGPLRLLAHEVYMRLNARGQRCNLVTGDERRTADDDPNASMTSCTVEMAPLNARYDVAVIDEIQMLGSEDRGWAWTQAVLGIQASEVHLCGEDRAVPIMRELAALCGEELHIHRYERLSPLMMMPKSLEGSVARLEKGDCVVCFSIVAIHGLRQLIEKTLKCKVAIIYGSLPPETRAQQAKLFNDPNNDYDILVASDAVGMGLNLSIKRLIFQSARKFLGGNISEIPVNEVKQIAGRAGRFSTAEQDMAKTDNLEVMTSSLTDGAEAQSAPETSRAGQVGLVTTLESYDHAIIQRSMSSEPVPILSAGILPPAYIVERFSKHFPAGTPFSFLLTQLNEVAAINSRFHLCALRQQCGIADAIEEVEGLSVNDRMIFCSSPCEPRKPGESAIIKAYAESVAARKKTTILDVEQLGLEHLDEDYIADRGYLAKLEALHKSVVTWMWLSYRYDGIFTERALAMHVKALIEKRIEDAIAQLSFDFQKLRKSREQAILDLLQQEGQAEERLDQRADEQAMMPQARRIEQLLTNGEEMFTSTTALLSNTRAAIHGTTSVLHEGDRVGSA